MSKVKLIVRSYNSLDFGNVTEIVQSLAKDQHIVGIIETEFEPEEDGGVRASDGIETVIELSDINNLQGRMLTIAEASCSDPEQRKALKDLIKQEVWSWYTERMDELSRAWRFDKGYEANEPFKNKHEPGSANPK